jgi:hypothetical protein
MTGDHGGVLALHFLELLCREVPLLVETEGLVYPGLQVQAVLHSPPITHLNTARILHL